MESLWQADAPGVGSDVLPAEAEIADVLVVGAGLAGLATAVVLARAGLGVVVVEARTVGAGTTGRTTAKVSRLQGTLLQRIRARSTAAVVEAYARSQDAAFAWLEDVATTRGVPWERREAVTVATTPRAVEALRREHRVARAHGVPTALATAPELPFRTLAALRLPDQAQVEPIRLLEALAAELRERGGRLVTGARVTSVEAHRDPRRAVLASTTRGSVRAHRLILTTGMPILDRGLYFAKVSAQRSYAAAWRVPESAVPAAMYVTGTDPVRSVREARGLLLTGGFGHPVGRAASPRTNADALAAWTRRHWPGAELVAEWSAQDLRSPHGVPFVGWLPRGGGRVFLATGFSKWGMTNAVAAALTLSGDILGGAPEWQRTLHRRPTLPLALAAGLAENAATGAWYARGWLRALRRPVPAVVPEGAGAVGRRGLRPIGRSTVGTRTREVCAICPHLGAVVQWNDYEQSWDCPAHGSRFAPDGAVLEGPARRPLSAGEAPDRSAS